MIALSTIIAILYIVGVLLLYKTHPKEMAGYLLLVVSHAYNLISLLLIESGRWIVEQERYGYLNGSTIIYTALLLSTLAGYWMAPALSKRMGISNYLRINNRPSRNNKELSSILIILLIYNIIFGYAAIQAIDVAGLHRHNFLQHTYPKWIIYFLVSTYSAIGWYAILRANGFVLRVVTVVLFSIGGIAYGGSFSTIITNTILFLVAQSLDSEDKSSHIKFYIFSGLAFFVATSVKIAQEYYSKKYTAEEIGLVFDFIESRLTVQAHLIWFSVERYLNDSLVDIGFIEFFLDFFNPTHTLTTDYGLGRLMYHANSGVAQMMIEEGIGMSGGFPSIVLAGGGIVPALLTCFIAGALFSMLFSFLVTLAKYYSILLFIPAFYFFNQYSNIIYNGDFGFINFKTLVYMLIFATLFHAGRRYMRGKVWPTVRI